MPDTVTLPLLRRASEFSPQSYNQADNTVDVLWTTGATVRRRSYGMFDNADEFDEQLILSPDAVRLDRLNGGAPFLNTHQGYDLESVIGSVVPGSAALTRSQGTAKVMLSRAPEHAGIIANIQAGVIRNVSVGYRIHAIERIEKDGQVPLVRVTDWEPFELSAVPVGADAGAGIRSDQMEAFQMQAFRALLTHSRAANENTPAANDSQSLGRVNHALRMRMRQGLIARR